MPALNRITLLFSLNSFAASMLALFIAFSVGLPMPYWAMTTAYIVSQPLSGAVRSKAIYRVLGSILGAAATVIMVPALVQSPVLLCIALALWVAGCLVISLLDRTPRSYVLMLAGYTAAIIGFASVNHPEAVFDTAVARVVEIGLGILCATLVHSLVFPRPVGGALQTALAAWLDDADRWALDLIDGAGEGAIGRDRRHLAASASDIRILASHLPFDTSRLRDTTAAVQAMQDRMLLLIPLLSGLSDRLDALQREGGGQDGPVREGLDAVAAWLRAGADYSEGLALTDRIAALTGAGSDWSGLLAESLLVRLADAVTALNEAHALLAHVKAPHRAVPAQVAAAISGARRRPMHTDLPLALLSGAAAVVAILGSCALWILGGWSDGGGVAIMAAVFCCFFASMDDPVPAIANFGLFSLLSMPVAALYLFAILPAVDGFPMLVMVLAPPLLLAGLYMPDPKRMGAALAFIMTFCSALALQETFTADFASFVNGDFAQMVGIFIAIVATGAMRSMGVDAGARRLLSRVWKGLAGIARARRAPEPAAFAGVLVDRMALLSPKLAQVDPKGDLTGFDALRDIRIGMNMVSLQRVRPDLSGQPRAAVDRLLGQLESHFSGLAARRDRSPAPALLAAIDEALVLLAGRAAADGVSGLVGLRRNLFPEAPAPRLEPAA